MQLLNELIELKADREFERLLEDLGNLKQAGLGRMVNAFKQSYAFYNGGRWDTYPLTSQVGKGIRSRETGIGRESTVISVKGAVKNWGFVKKAFRDAETAGTPPCAAVFYVDNKAVALFVMSMDTIASIKNTLGVSWDFTGVADQDEVTELIQGIPEARDSQYHHTITKDPDTNPKGSETKKVIHHSDWNASERRYVEKTELRHYAGISMQVRSASGFIDKLVDLFGTRLTLRVITVDSRASEKRKGRQANRPIDPKEVKLFKDDLKTRLAKFKIANAPTVENVHDLVEKIFTKEVKKVKFAGTTWSTNATEAYESNQIQALFNGKVVSVSFSADQTLDYNSRRMKLFVKLVGRELKPVKISYHNSNGAATTEEF